MRELRIAERMERERKIIGNKSIGGMKGEGEGRESR